MNLEALLEEAVKNPDRRNEFIDRLMQSRGYVIGMHRKNEEGVIDENSPADLFILKRGSDKPNGLPLFTSKEKLLNFAKELASGTPPMLEVECCNVFKTAKNVSILLNPNAEYGKEFTPPEIANIVSVLAERERNTHVEVVVPEEEPTDITVDLQYFFKKKKNVERAWLFELRNPQVKPHYLFVVDFEGDKDELFGEMTDIIEPHLEDDDDFMQIISAEEELSKKITAEAEPFYVRKRGLFRR